MSPKCGVRFCDAIMYRNGKRPRKALLSKFNSSPDQRKPESKQKQPKAVSDDDAPPESSAGSDDAEGVSEPVSPAKKRSGVETKVRKSPVLPATWKTNASTRPLRSKQEMQVPSSDNVRVVDETRAHDAVASKRRKLSPPRPAPLSSLDLDDDDEWGAFSQSSQRMGKQASYRGTTQNIFKAPRSSQSRSSASTATYSRKSS